MQIIKKKSLVVALISSVIIALVLILTLVSYVIYTELKSEELKRTYDILIRKVNAKFYSRYLDVSKLTASFEKEGALKGKPVIDGVLNNKGTRTITDILLKVDFLDRNGAVIYEVLFHPQESSLGRSLLTHVNLPYLATSGRISIKPGGLLPFKGILTNCPAEILSALHERAGFSKGNTARWSGKFSHEFLSIDF